MLESNFSRKMDAKYVSQRAGIGLQASAPFSKTFAHRFAVNKIIIFIVTSKIKIIRQHIVLTEQNNLHYEVSHL